MSNLCCKIKIIKAKKSDALVISRLEEEAIPEDLYTQRVIEENIFNKNMLTYVVELNNCVDKYNPKNNSLSDNIEDNLNLVERNIVGYATLSYFEEEGELLKICIDPIYQRNHIGTKLLKKIIAELKKIGVKVLFLEVRENNLKAINFYEKFGFVKINLRKQYYKDGTNALIYKYDINV